MLPRRPLGWLGTGRHPIPDDWRYVGSRAWPLSGTNRKATHPVNAMLNFGYALLEARIRLTGV